MKLSSRLKKIADLVDNGSRVADIGSDHGYIPIYLLENRIVPFAILSDINKGPLENGKKEILKRNLIEKVDIRIGSGIETLDKNEVDEIIITGMGGILISEILEARKDISRSGCKLILQPMQAQNYLRKYLLQNGFNIENEVLAKEDSRIYQIIVARYTGVKVDEYDEVYYEVGKKLIEKRDKLLNIFIKQKIKMYKKIVENLKETNNDFMKVKLEFYIKMISRLERIYNDGGNS